MSSLEQYIRDNRERFDNGPLPVGSKERFMANMESSSAGGRHNMIFAYAAGIAACLMIGLMIGWEAARPVEYEYMSMLRSLDEEITEMSGSCDRRTAEEAVRASRSIIEENIPLSEQLPSELSEAEREDILKDYYRQRAEGLERIKNYIAMQSQNN